MSSDWTSREKHAYRLGIQKGRNLQAEEQSERELPSLLDRFAMAALANSKVFTVTQAYDWANAMLRERSIRRTYNENLDDEIPF